MVVKKVVVSKILTDNEIKDLEGTWIEEHHIKHPIIEEDTDVYYLDESVELIHNYIDKNPLKAILVHCFMGSSRSATIIIAYLIKYKEFRLRDALNYLKEKRNVVNLNILYVEKSSLNLSDKEKEQFDLSINAVKDLYEAAKNIDQSL